MNFLFLDLLPIVVTNDVDAARPFAALTGCDLVHNNSFALVAQWAVAPKDGLRCWWETYHSNGRESKMHPSS